MSKVICVFVKLPRLGLLSLWFVLFAVSGKAQSRLDFPRILSPQEMATTGFAFVNTSPAQINAAFTFYGVDGTIQGQSSLSVPAKGQVARLGSEILSNLKVSAWVQVSSSTSELQGFEIVGDFAKVVDGAGPAAEATQLAVIHFTKQDTVYIVNPGSQPVTAVVALNSPTGAALASKSIQLSAFQESTILISDLTADDNVDELTITATGGPVSAALTTKLPTGADIGITNAVPAANAPSELYFPFVPSGRQSASSVWTTLLGVTNLASTSQSVSLTFTYENGATSLLQVTLAPGATVGGAASTLFSLPSSSFSQGWIRVIGSGPLTGVAAYQDSASGALAIVPSQSSGSTRFLFGHIAQQPPWYTGLALLNASTSAANVEVFATDSNGQLIGAAAGFSLPPNTRRTSVLSEFVSESNSNGGWVFVRTTNNVPILGFELFGHSLLPILANVQGFALPATSVYTPPRSGANLAVTIDHLSAVDLNGAAKTQFKPLDGIFYVASVVNSTGAPANAQVTYTVLDPRNQLLLTSASTGSLQTGASDVPFISYIPSNALTGTYTFSASLVYQGKLATQTMTFDVVNGSTTPTVDQSTPISATTSNTPQFAFRPGDTVRFVIPMGNFTGQTVSAAFGYQLTGPGNVSAGSNSLNLSIPPGLYVQTVDFVIPASINQQGLFVFTSTFSIGGTVTRKSAPITVVPKSAGESIVVDTVYVGDSAGTPKGGLAPGSAATLFIWQFSSFPVSIPRTGRYTVTGPNATVILDTTVKKDMPTGTLLTSLPVSLPSSAAAGDYTFQGAVTYVDNSNSTKTSSQTTTFTVSAAPPAPKENIVALHPYVLDINFITRTSVSPAEPFILTSAVYSTFAASVSGTIRYDILQDNGASIFNSTSNVTYKPGINLAFLFLSSSSGIPLANYTLKATATVQNITSISSSTLAFAGAASPSFSSFTTDSARLSDSGENAVETARPVQEIWLDDTDGFKRSLLPALK